jgi:hypothetical protein
MITTVQAWRYEGQSQYLWNSIAEVQEHAHNGYGFITKKDPIL